MKPVKAEKLNIAFISDTFCPDVNGVVTHLKIIIKELADRGHRVTVYTHKKAIDPFNMENVKISKLQSIELPTYPGIYMCIPNPLKLRKRLILQNPDVIHIHSPPGPLSITALIIAKNRRIPVVATIQGLWCRYEYYIPLSRMLKGVKLPFAGNFLKLLKTKIPFNLKKVRINGFLGNFEIKKNVIWGVVRAMCNKCDLVVVPSRLSAKKISAYKIPCVALPYGIDVENFRMKKSYARTGRILSVCRLGYEKNLDMLIRAFSLLVKKYPKAKLTLVGDGPARSSLVELTKNLGLQDRVSFEGTVERSKLQKYFDTHDFFANASDSELFGCVTAEAMAAGLPIVAVEAQGSQDLVKHRINGFLAKPNSVVDFAKAMDRMMDRNTNLKKMGTASRRLVQDFSVEKCYNNHVKIYRKLVKKKLAA